MEPGRGDREDPAYVDVICRRYAAMEPGRGDREDGSLKSYRLACGNAAPGERLCPARRSHRCWRVEVSSIVALTWVRALPAEGVGTGALASDDLRVVAGEGASLADEGEPGAGGVAEVDDDDGVFGELHLPFD